MHSKCEILIHKIFAQTDEGRELLSEMQKSLIMMPGDRLGNDLFNLGKEEGRKEFIRNIINTIETIEGNANE